MSGGSQIEIRLLLLSLKTQTDRFNWNRSLSFVTGTVRLKNNTNSVKSMSLRDRYQCLAVHYHAQDTRNYKITDVNTEPKGPWSD